MVLLLSLGKNHRGAPAGEGGTWVFQRLVIYDVDEGWFFCSLWERTTGERQLAKAVGELSVGDSAPAWAQDVDEGRGVLLLSLASRGRRNSSCPG